MMDKMLKGEGKKTMKSIEFFGTGTSLPMILSTVRVKSGFSDLTPTVF
jgi:hypothetical protein